jgi:hypothetical protein
MVKTKKRPPGRPKLDTVPITVRPLNSELAAIDRWIRRNAPGLSRPMAIRRLLAAGLTSAKPAGPIAREAAAKASRMAGQEIERIVDKSAPAAERAKRKRRLIQGPTEFRGMRKD